MIATLAALLLAAPPALGSPRASPCAPRGDADDEVRAEACGLLGAIDQVVPEGAWRALGPAADAVLAEIARADGPAVRRARALEALAARGSAAAAVVHQDLATARDVPIQVRRAAVRGLSRLLDGAALVDSLGPLAERDADGRVRAAASEILARRTPAEACPGIRARASAGSEDTIRLERALAACAAADR